VGVYIDRRCSLSGVYDRDAEVVLETTDSAPPPPPPLRMSGRCSADESDDDDDDDDVTASARSRSPSSDVENILDSLRDTTTTYYGDFTLRRVFSLEEELVSHHTVDDDASDSAVLRKPKTTSMQAALGGQEDDRRSMQTTWTLPLARRLTPAAVGKTLTRVFRQFNGFAQARTAVDDGDSSRLPDKSVVSASATAMIHSPVNIVDHLSTTPSSRPDIVPSTSRSVEKDREAMEQALRVQTVHVDGSTATCDGLASADNDSIKQTKNGGVRGQTNQTRSATTSFSCASVKVDEVQQRDLEVSGSHCSRSDVVSGSPSQSTATATDEFPQSKADVTPTVKSVQRSSSNRDASRPPIQPRPSSPNGARWRRSATPSRTSVDCLPGLTTIGASRTSSCEVLVDDDDSRLSDIITRRSGVSRRSSLASSAADDGDSTAASETDSLAACVVDVDDSVSNSLLDRLLMRLRSTPRDSSSSRGRPPSAQTSMSSSSDEETDPHSAVDVTVQRVLPSCVRRKHCSLLSSLDDFTSDSDFELGSSLSQLMVTSGNFPHHSSAAHNYDRLSGTAASIADLPRHTGDQLNKYREWLENYTNLAPRPALNTGRLDNWELVNSATTGLSAPITESQAVQTHVARTSRIPKY